MKMILKPFATHLSLVNAQGATSGDLYQAEKPGSYYHNHIYLAMPANKGFVDLTEGGRERHSGDEAIFRCLPNGTEFSFIQEERK